MKKSKRVVHPETIYVIEVSPSHGEPYKSVNNTAAEAVSEGSIEADVVEVAEYKLVNKFSGKQRIEYDLVD